MANSHKKVIVRQFDGSLTWGYLPFTGFVHADSVELLDPTGRVLDLPLKNIKTVAYVRDFNLDDPSDPERIGRRSFAARPRGEGLWLRLEFHDHDSLEGLAPMDLGFLDATMEDKGLSLTPPEPKSNTQRIFAPRSALAALQVLGWITSPSRHKLPRAATQTQQADLFEL